MTDPVPQNTMLVRVERASRGVMLTGCSLSLSVQEFFFSHGETRGCGDPSVALNHLPMSCPTPEHLEPRCAHLKASLGFPGMYPDQGDKPQLV